MACPKLIRCWILLASILMQMCQLQAEEKEQDTRLFESRIRPLLVQRCYKCHSRSAGKAEGELLLDSREGLRKGGARGPAVVPKKPDESLLLTAISHTDPDFRMPPKGKRVADELLRDVVARFAESSWRRPASAWRKGPGKSNSSAALTRVLARNLREVLGQVRFSHSSTVQFESESRPGNQICRN